jgi:hypothetical protein
VSGALIVFLFFWCVIGGGVGYAIGNAKGRGPSGFWWGFLLGVIGWIVIALMSPTPEEEARRAHAVASALHAQMGGDSQYENATSSAPTRDCPWCAESIKPSARLCRFCGHTVDPIVPFDLDDVAASEQRDVDVAYDTSGWTDGERQEFIDWLNGHGVAFRLVGSDVRIERKDESLTDSYFV